MTDVLELRHLGRVFPGFQLGPLSLRLHPGQVYGLLGPNGAGKTTLLDLIALQLKATAGTLSYGSRPIHWGDSAWEGAVQLHPGDAVVLRRADGCPDPGACGSALHLLGPPAGGHARREVCTATSPTGPAPLERHQGEAGHRDGAGAPGCAAHPRRANCWSRPPPRGADLQDTVRLLIREHPSLCVLLSSHIFEDIDESATEIVIMRRGRLVFHACADTLQNATLYRSEAPGAVAASRDLLLRWRRRETTWLLVRRGSPLDAELCLRPDQVTQHPTSMLAAIYHGTEHADVD